MTPIPTNTESSSQATRTRTATVRVGTATRRPTNTPKPDVVQDISYRVGREFDAGDSPSAIAAGDFNGDGFVDVALVSRTRSTLKILLGERNSFFSDGPAQPGTGREPVAILATDLDDDDKIDLVTADATDGTVSLFVNDGSANFSAIARVAIEGEPSALTEIGDRIAVADRLNSRVVLLRKLGDGRLEVDTTAPTGGEPIAIGAANFDADGRPDLITANGVGESVSVLLASGSAFEAPRNFSLGGVPGALSLGDFDVDGITDFAVTLPLVSRIAVYRQQPQNRQFVLAFQADVAARPSAILLADDQSLRITGDTFPDLLVISDEASVFTLFEGKVPETEPPFEEISRFTLPAGPLSFVASEFDRDAAAFADLVVPGEDADQIMLLRGRGQGSYIAATTFRTDLGPVAISTGDFDQDRKTDILTANLNANTVSFLKGNGRGSVRNQGNSPVLVAPNLIGSGELTGDAFLDIVLASSTNATAAIYRGDGLGAFEGGREIFLAGSPSALAVGDVNDDSQLDIAFADRESRNIDIFVNLRNSGFPAFVLAATGAPSDVALADFNQDGLIDVVAAIPEAEELNVWFHLRDDRFTEAMPYATGAAADRLALADFNGDDQLDIVTANRGESSITILLGDAGGFLVPRQIGLDYPPIGVATEDLNLDGKADVVVLSDVGGRVISLSGDGRGNFPRRTTFTGGVEPQAFAVSQVTNDENGGDRLPDIVVADYPSDRLTVMRNTSDSPPATATPRPTSTPRAVESSGGGGCQAQPDGSRDVLVVLILVAVGAMLVRYSGRNA